MYNKAILENGRTLEPVPDGYKNQKMCNQAVNNYAHILEFVSYCYKLKKCVTNLLILILLQGKLFLNTIRLKKCVQNLFFCI